MRNKTSILFLTVFAALGGCIASPMGTKPQPVTGEPNTFKFKMFVNAYAGGDSADERMKPILEKFQQENGFSGHKIIERQYNSSPTSYEYFVRFDRP